MKEENEKWLEKLVAAFGRCREELERAKGEGKGEGGSIDFIAYVDACSLIQDVFGHLGSVFEFAKKDLVDKEAQLRRNCGNRKISVREAITADFEDGRAVAGTSNSRTLHRVTNSVKFLNLLLVDLLRDDNKDHLRVSAHRAFKGSIEYYLAWPVKKAVGVGLYLLPSRDKFLKRIGETLESAKPLAKEVVECSSPVLDHVYGIYKDLGIDL